GAAGAGAAAGLAAGAAAASAYGARNTLSRADALAAERDWEQEDDGDYHEPAEEPEKRGRSPWTWPLIALILLVLFSLVGIVLTQAGILFPETPASSSSAVTTSAKPTTTSASPTSSSPSPTATSATPTQSTPAAINLIPEEYLGKQYNDVRSALIGLGLTVDGAEVFNDAAPGTVVDINPSGPVQPGDTITVSYSKGPETQEPETVPVPTLQSGDSEKAVQKAIEDAGLRWAKGADVDPANGEEPGTFVSSEPPSGSPVPAGSVVTYHLAKAPAADSSPSPTGT
ncbi:MAG TPA: PASTA domain-containing protein, partial [Arthrobacter sp.]